MNRYLARALAAAAFIVGASLGSAAQAQSCDAGKAGDELSFDEAAAVYDCLKGAMVEGYRKGAKRWIPAAYVNDYRDWKPASTGPAAPGQHGGRFLVTYVNDIGHDAYVRYAEGVEMPAGTLIAKESFTVSNIGAAKAGPLFLMEKVAEGTSPETGDWHYMMVSARGAPQAVNVARACHDCHSGFDYQDFMGYPVEEVRLGQ